MPTLSILEAKNRLDELVREVEAGETVVLTRDGAPVADLKPHPQPKRGLRLEAIEAFKKKHGIDSIFPHVPEDFDDPLPEDFLLRPLPQEK